MKGALEQLKSEHSLAPEGFEILDELGKGGMAMVYLAKQFDPQREVALKVALPRYAEDDGVRERFKREGRALAALEHPAILPIYQVGDWNGLPYMAMKLARGGTLETLLHDSLPDFKKVMSWMIAAGEAVHFAHENGVLHRDLKPGNILFGKDGEIYVGDFGVASLNLEQDTGLTQTHALLGTPCYLAPEIASGELIGGSVRSDLYGLGAVFYECLTGERPYAGAANLAAQLRAVVEEEIVPVRKIRPEVPVDLATICEKALSKKPEDRYGSVEEMVDDLRRYEDGVEILGGTLKVREKALRQLRSRPGRAVLLVVCVSVLLGSVFLRKRVQSGESERTQTTNVSSSRLRQEPSSLTDGRIVMVEGNQSWLNSYVWSDNAVPSPDKDYVLSALGPKSCVRSSPANTVFGGTVNFPGKSLLLPVNTTLLVKQTGAEVASINEGLGDLILEGGRLLFGPGGQRIYLGLKSDHAEPVLRVNQLRVASAEGARIEINHRIVRALIDGLLTGPGDILIDAQNGRSVDGGRFVFSRVDEQGFTGTITVDRGVVLDFNSDVRFEGGLKIRSDARLIVDQALSFPRWKLEDPNNGLVLPGVYQGESLSALGDSYINNGGSITVRP